MTENETGTSEPIMKSSLTMNESEDNIPTLLPYTIANAQRLYTTGRDTSGMIFLALKDIFMLVYVPGCKISAVTTIFICGSKFSS